MSQQRENGYDVRPGRAGDFPAVAGLSKLWADEGCTTGYPGMKEGDERLQSWLAEGYFFVGEHEDLVMAYAAGAVREHTLFKPEGERFLHIHEVFVHLHHRDKGVGGRLVKALLARSKAEGIGRSMVGSNNVDWSRTYRFYERFGYGMFSIQMYI